MTPARGAIVPHAPLLVPGVLAEPPADVADAATATAEVDVSGADVVVLVSPHGHASGVYAEVGGSLASAGPGGFDVGAPTDAGAVGEVAGRWGKPVLDGPCDHGIIVPMLLMDVDAPVVAVTLAHSTGPGARHPEAAAGEGRDLAAALAPLLRRRRAAVVASAHTSAAIGAAAPLPDRPAAARLEAAVLGSLAEPAGLAAIPAALWADAGSCGAGPLTCLGLVLGGRGLSRTHYSHPFGVGYLVAATS